MSLVDEDIPNWQKAIAGGSLCLALALMAYLKLFTSVMVNPPQVSLDFQAQILFIGFMVGNLSMAYGLLGFFNERHKPKPVQWNAKEEVRKWMEKS